MEDMEIARQAVIAIASEDEYWSKADERLVNIEPNYSDGPGHYTFSVAGTFHTDRGCVVVKDGLADVHYHDDETMRYCSACGWRSEF